MENRKCEKRTMRPKESRSRFSRRLAFADVHSAGTCLLLIAMMSVASAFASADRSFREELRERLRNRIEGVVPFRYFVADGERIHGSPAVAEFYVSRGYQPAWMDGRGLSDGARQLIALLRNAKREGLQPDDYHLSRIDSYSSRLRDHQNKENEAYLGLWSDLELLLSDAYLLFATHLLVGRVDPETFDPHWHVLRGEADLLDRMENALRAGRIQESLRELLPTHPDYLHLRRFLERLMELESLQAWPVVPEGPKMEKGDRGERVRMLRSRLAASGDLSEGEVPDEYLFDEGVEAGVRRFQKRHGLEADGVVGRVTMLALNTPIEERILQIRLNMERWRWLPRNLGSRYILINIAGFFLDVVEQGKKVLSMRVVVGRPYRSTPVFSDLMTYLVFNPFWHVPPRLAVQDILPKVRSNPQYLQEEGIRVFRGWGFETVELNPDDVDWENLKAANFHLRFRQEPGVKNALGKVKFMFPNRFNVYLHDSPARELFGRSERAFSSGCIRVEKPVELAAYLLRDDPAWNPDRIRREMEGVAEKTVLLPSEMPIHLLYWTAWVEADGSIHFRKDIYGRDELLRRALEKHPPGASR